MKVRRQHHAYTLIEVVIVATVIAIAATVVLPMFGDTKAAKLRAAAQMLSADIAYAQVESMAHGDNPYMLVFDTVSHMYHIARASDSNTPVINPIGKQRYEVIFGQGRAMSLTDVKIANVSLNGDNIVTFGLYGQTDQTMPATITLSCGEKSVVITIDPYTGSAIVGSIQ